MSKNEISAQINMYLKTEFFSDDPEMLNSQTGLLSDGYIDSVSVMILVEHLEKTFDFEFEPHEVDADNLDSIDRMVAFIEHKKS
jgi:acyl carrier protein